VLLCSYVHADFLTPEDLWEVAGNFPESRRHLLRKVLFEAFKQYLVRLGKDVLAAKRAQTKGTLKASSDAARLLEDPKKVAFERLSKNSRTMSMSSTDAVGAEPMVPLEMTPEFLSSIGAALVASPQVHHQLRLASARAIPAPQGEMSSGVRNPLMV